MQFTLVSTIFNEASRLKQTIADLEAQTLKPSEIIITDAGSNDGSIAILEEWSRQSDIKITILIEKGCNVARGRNLAIEATTTQWIVSTDFGCRFHRQWLESLIAPFSNNEVQVVGGAFSVIETDIISIASKANYILSNGYSSSLSKSFIPSSRSIAYKKDVWQKVEKYPEWLTLAADDLVFGLKIQSQNIPIYLVDQPYVYWGRHEKRQQYNKEAFRYGLGDGESRVNYRNFWSNLIETGLRYTFFLSLLFWLIQAITYILKPNYPLSYLPNVLTTYWPMVLLTFLSLPGLRSYYGAFKNWLKIKSKKYSIGVFFLSVLMLEQQRIKYIKGYIKGYWYSSDKVQQGAVELHNFLNLVSENKK